MNSLWTYPPDRVACNLPSLRKSMMMTFLCHLPVPNRSATPLSNTSTTQISSMALDRLVPWSHHPLRTLGTSDSDDNSLPFLGDPEPEFFGEMTLLSISLIGVAAFKWLIDASEEVYTINIQPN